MPADTTSPPTSRDGTTTDLVESYWRDIRHFEPLSRAEEGRLVRRARAGDTTAGEALVTANLRFVVTVAKKYTSYGMSFSELIAEGNCGLLEAVKRFDETRGFKFITYAVWWIRQAILKALAEHSLDFHLGGVTIAERHAKYGNEHMRLMEKSAQGCEFFISQAVYNAQATIDLLSSMHANAASKVCNQSASS